MVSIAPTPESLMKRTFLLPVLSTMELSMPGVFYVHLHYGLSRGRGFHGHRQVVVSLV